MSTHTRWWWVRHAPVPDNGRIYGQRDLDCDCGDANVFAALAHQLPRDAIWLTSNLVRTQQTAAAILAAAPDRFRGTGFLAIPEFAEQHLGEWQGLERKPFYAARKVGVETLWFAPADECPPGGESFAALTERVGTAILRLTEEHRGRDIVAVTHGGTIRAALGLALQLPPQLALSFAVENCSITRLDHIGGAPPPGLWRIAGVNQRPWQTASAAGGIDKA
ncbi:MAG TPA: histidine phosphatase family protein [Hyphomicrobiaceae bacterium]|nr:histidine phosphatase family protein [Hyphomicrobiaceae bacterium]